MSKSSDEVNPLSFFPYHHSHPGKFRQRKVGNKARGMERKMQIQMHVCVTRGCEGCRKTNRWFSRYGDVLGDEKLQR